MSTDLRERLQKLAQGAQMTPLAPTDLWHRGRRWRRQRALGLAVVAASALTALAVLGGVSWQRAAVPEPAAQVGEAVMPDRIYDPGRWLPGTDEAGPPGQLVALAFAERGSWTGTREGVVGISAITGEYRFLDLPDAVLDTDPAAALSPDGQLVAYWLTGETTGSPNTNEGQLPPIVGIGVYDTRTGEVRKELISTEHGLATQVLLWADDNTLVFEFVQWRGGDGDSAMDQSSGTTQPARIWRLEQDNSEELKVQGLASISVVASTADGTLQVEGGRSSRLRLVDVAALRVLADLPVRRASLSSDLVLDPSRTRVAAVWGGGGDRWRNPNYVVAGSLPPSPNARESDVELARVPDSGRTFTVLGWLDANRIAVVRRVGTGFGASAVFAVDVRTGEAVERTRLPDDSYGTQLEFATGLLAAPVVDAPKPQRPLDPRLAVGLGGGIVVTALVAGVAWMRRVRP